MSLDYSYLAKLETEMHEAERETEECWDLMVKTRSTHTDVRQAECLELIALELRAARKRAAFERAYDRSRA